MLRIQACAYPFSVCPAGFGNLLQHLCGCVMLLGCVPWRAVLGYPVGDTGAVATGERRPGLLALLLCARDVVGAGPQD
jgi:hypothetical protein